MQEDVAQGALSRVHSAGRLRCRVGGLRTSACVAARVPGPDGLLPPAGEGGRAATACRRSCCSRSAASWARSCGRV